MARDDEEAEEAEKPREAEDEEEAEEEEEADEEEEDEEDEEAREDRKGEESAPTVSSLVMPTRVSGAPARARRASRGKRNPELTSNLLPRYAR